MKQIEKYSVSLQDLSQLKKLKRSEVAIVAGAVASGKTTIAKKLIEMSGFKNVLILGSRFFQNTGFNPYCINSPFFDISMTRNEIYDFVINKNIDCIFIDEAFVFFLEEDYLKEYRCSYWRSLFKNMRKLNVSIVVSQQVNRELCQDPNFDLEKFSHYIKENDGFHLHDFVQSCYYVNPNLK